MAERDAVGNVNQGLSPDGKKWFTKVVAKNYPICYTEQDLSRGLWLLISVSTGPSDSATATATTNGTSSTTNIKAGTATTFTLKPTRMKDGHPEVLRTFQRSKSNNNGGSVTGLIRSFQNPEQDVILDALNWLSNSDLHPVPPK